MELTLQKKRIKCDMNESVTLNENHGLNDSDDEEETHTRQGDESSEDYFIVRARRNLMNGENKETTHQRSAQRTYITDNTGSGNLKKNNW